MKPILIKTPFGSYVNAEQVSAIEIHSVPKGYVLILELTNNLPLELVTTDTLSEAEELRDSLAERIGQVYYV